MRIKLNGEARELEAPLSLKEFVVSEGLKPEGVAVAVDGNIVPKARWDGFVVGEGMSVDIYDMVAGG